MVYSGLEKHFSLKFPALVPSYSIKVVNDFFAFVCIPLSQGKIIDILFFFYILPQMQCLWHIGYCAPPPLIVLIDLNVKGHGRRLQFSARLPRPYSPVFKTHGFSFYLFIKFITLKELVASILPTESYLKWQLLPIWKEFGYLFKLLMVWGYKNWI